MLELQWRNSQRNDIVTYKEILERANWIAQLHIEMILLYRKN